MSARLDSAGRREVEESYRYNRQPLDGMHDEPCPAANLPWEDSQTYMYRLTLSRICN
jgi:hypothetical protein